MLTNLSAFAPGAPLHPLTLYKQWLLFQRTTWDAQKQKWDKKPIQANGWGMPWRSAPHKLMTYSEAVEALAAWPDCTLGFVLTPEDPFFLWDADNCAEYNADGSFKCWNAQTLEVINRFPGAAVEVSMSGNGIHVIGSTVDIPHGCENSALHAEFYTKHRAIALTGNVSGSGSADTDQTLNVIPFVTQYYPRIERERKAADVEATSADLDKAREAIKFIDPMLHYDNWLACCMALHAAGVDANMEDEAWAIAEELTQQSPKYQPGYLEFKWGSFNADREVRYNLNTLFHWAKEGGYKTREEIDAAEAFAAFKAQQAPVVVPPPPSDTPKIIMSGFGAVAVPPPPPTVEVEERDKGILYPSDYLPLFGAMCYIASLHCIWTPEGELFDQKRFDAMFTGPAYALDMEGRKLVDSPWEAYFKCRTYMFRRVRGACFRPDLPTAAIIEQEGRTHINIYFPIQVPCAEGDVGLFLLHLEKVLPNERDRRILLSYMASLVQNPGKKFRWAPLLQGEEGNGKTFFTHCLEQAVGEKYTHYPQAQDLDNKFNAWQLNKILIAVEDIYVPGHKANIVEVLKPMITGDRQPIQGKGSDQITSRICANFMFNSNHRGALGQAVKGRRYCVFFTAQQSVEDIERAGMDGVYFKGLYDWAHAGGFAAVTYFLRNYKIDPEFDPAGTCIRAPHTSTYTEVIQEAQGVIEQEILAAIIEERPGFASPWISSQAVDKLLQSQGYDRRIPRNKRRALIESLGYVRHPYLPEGRTNNAVMPDGARTTLFVKKGHPALELKTAAMIAEKYGEAQISRAVEKVDGIVTSK
jgi:hypothetical protein